MDKWSGIRGVAAHHGVPDDAIAAIGDEINDVPLLRHAACGVAMGNAAESAAAVADRRTLSNREDASLMRSTACSRGIGDAVLGTRSLK